MNSFHLNIGRFYVQTVFKRYLSKGSSSSEYCMNLVKTYDYENFLCSLLLTKDCRSCAFAVRSFNVEIARIAEQVTQKEIALMRFKFWEDALDNCFMKSHDKVPKHPVVLELSKAINKHGLSKRSLKNLIIARKEHLNLNCFQSLEQMESYVEKTHSPIFYLILESGGVRNVNADHAASHLGKAQGIVQQLRCLHISKKINFISVPQSVLIKNSVSYEQILQCKSSQAVNDCVYEVASRAYQHLMKARSLQDIVPSDAKSVFLPAIAVFSYLDRLQKIDYNIFDENLQQRQWNLLLQLWFNNIRNKF